MPYREDILDQADEELACLIARHQKYVWFLDFIDHDIDAVEESGEGIIVRLKDKNLASYGGEVLKGLRNAKKVDKYIFDWIQLRVGENVVYATVEESIIGEEAYLCLDVTSEDSILEGHELRWDNEDKPY